MYVPIAWSQKQRRGSPWDLVYSVKSLSTALNLARKHIGNCVIRRNVWRYLLVLEMGELGFSFLESFSSYIFILFSFLAHSYIFLNFFLYHFYLLFLQKKSLCVFDFLCCCSCCCICCNDVMVIFLMEIY